ncbi:MAG: hypothetical protein Q4G22_01545 [Paracoccus sp. (in: a-proteobacteria)]|uniref:hypothetical protein n=1 Tax=Paracoccus sp. TaxID=267 RepID=UPI0026DFC7BA|nr:hypothetical protein [Paracoccus sp. (in: a-proteobacteria)]MDO5630501.1 hypothetical protein [Paracoccus sp. (in: a-proteobacteria)]
MADGIFALIYGFVSMLADLLRGRFPRDPYDFAVLVLLVLIGAAALVYVLT